MDKRSSVTKARWSRARSVAAALDISVRSEAGHGMVRHLSDADVSDLVTLGVQITGMANGEQLRREEEFEDSALDDRAEDARRDFEEGP